MLDIEKSLKDAEVLVRGEDYEGAVKLLRPCAEAGNAEAQCRLGVLYHLGQGVERNLTLAIEWLQNSAEQGNGVAAHNLGTLYLTCEPDMPPNPEESKKWFRKAKELGCVLANPEWYA